MKKSLLAFGEILFDVYPTGAKIGGDGPIAHVGTGLTIGAGATVKEGAKVFDSVKEGEEVC